MQGLSSFGIVLVGSNFAVQRIQLDDFDFGAKLEVQFRLSQLVQASAGEYVLQIIPNRFQVVATSAPATTKRIEVLKRAALIFAENYTTKRSIEAVGHNFTGDFASAIGPGVDFMKHVAWPEDFAMAVGAGATADPGLSVVVRTKVSEEADRTLRLEPLVRDDSRVFYDLNFNWGQAENPIKSPLDKVLDQFSDSVKIGSELVDRIAALGSDVERSES